MAVVCFDCLYSFSFAEFLCFSLLRRCERIDIASVDFGDIVYKGILQYFFMVKRQPEFL